MGGIKALGLVGGQFGLSGGAWHGERALNAKFNSLGFVVIGIFITAWVGSVLIYHNQGLDAVEAGN